MDLQHLRMMTLNGYFHIDINTYHTKCNPYYDAFWEAQLDTISVHTEQRDWAT